MPISRPRCTSRRDASCSVRSQARSYRLLYGHAEAAAPQYDFVRLVDDAAIESAVGATAGTEQLNAGFVDSAPWTERHPWLLWMALAVAVLVLGALAIRTMRSAAG